MTLSVKTVDSAMQETLPLLSSHGPVKVYYHYTDATGYKAIIENPEMDNDGRVAAILRPSRQALSGDAHYGDGWYLTDISPFGGNRLKIARALWDGSFEQNYDKTEYYLALQVHGNTRIIECRRHVFLIPIGSKSRPTLYGHGPIPQPEKLPYARWPRIAPQKQEANIAAEQNRRTSEHGSLFQRLKQWLGFYKRSHKYWRSRMTMQASCTKPK